MTSRYVAAAVLYVAVVLLAARSLRTRGIALAAAGCGLLTVLACLWGAEAPANAAIAMLAIGLTAFIVIRGRSAEDAVGRSQAIWREFFEHNPFMYFLVDSAGTVLSVNSAGAAELGYRVDELEGQSVLPLFPDSDRGRVRENLRLCLETLGQSNSWEVQKIRKDGATLWVRENAKAIERSKGDAVVLIACENITERKRAEEAVRESATRFRALIEHAYEVVLLVGRDASILYASPSVERVLGYPPREMVGRNGFDLLHPDQLEDGRSRLAAAEAISGGSFTTERLVRHKHGNWLWIENTVTNLLDEPSVRAFVVNLRDIDARKRAEEALRESEQRFREYAESASDWFWESGPDHRFASFSHRAPVIGAGLGATRWELAADIDEDPEKWRAHRAILDAHEPFREFTYKQIRPDGSAIHISVSGRPVLDQQGRFLGYRGVAADVSDRIRADEAERALQDARMELAHVARVMSLGELTASIAHEINQPLAAVIINAATVARWLDMDPPNLAEARRALGLIARDGRRASDVIARVRALAKKDPIPMDRIDINEAILEVLALTRGELVRNRVALKTRLADPALLILGDRVQLQQVILNLVLNAVDAMSEGEPRELAIETGKGDGVNVFVSVSDSGSGLDPAKRARLFEPFYSTKPGGMGMGLSICRSILESHQGRIWARPNEGRGSTFAFALPLAAEPTALAAR